LLYKLAKNLPLGQAIVEIGSWKGKSTVWLAKGAAAGQRNKVYSIDPHQGSEAHIHISESEEDTYPAFLANLTKAGIQDIVVPLITTSQQVARWWRRSIGLLWIDGSHNYEDVKRDLFLWKQYLVNLMGLKLPFMIVISLGQLLLL
ncbi:class I SAM-dependent methyltransferase, partial [Dehalococcoidales bacterium]|nr:class I SAM-dependent methyltransferase [Dehalococcoidales bacterium]